MQFGTYAYLAHIPNLHLIYFMKELNYYEFTRFQCAIIQVYTIKYFGKEDFKWYNYYMYTV